MTSDKLDFDAYVASRSPELLRSAWLLTGDVQEAEDLVQTALARLFHRWEQVRRADDVDAYVRRSLINASHSRFRRRRVRTVPLTREHESRATPGRDLAAVEDRHGLAAALGALPRRQRQIVVLRYLDDLSEAETAHALGCSVGSVKSGASRGLARLRDHPALSNDVRSSA